MTEEFIHSIIDRFDNSSLTEFYYDDGSASLILKKGAEVLAGAPQGYAAGGISATSPPSAARRTGIAQAEVPADSDSQSKAPTAAGGAPAGVRAQITSPVVGTFYATAAPDSPPFVTKGSRVKKGETLCVLEAMKMMNHLDAEFDCEIVEIKAASGDLVEYGQVLFEVIKT